MEDCKAHEECNKSFPNLKNDYLTLVSRLKEQPVTERIYHPLSGKPVDMVLTQDKVTDALRSTLYALGSRVILPYAVNKAANADYRAIAAMIGHTDDPKRAPCQF